MPVQRGSLFSAGPRILSPPFAVLSSDVAMIHAVGLSSAAATRCVELPLQP